MVISSKAQFFRVQAYFPPLTIYFIDSNRVRAISLAMGLQPVMWTRVSVSETFDTGGEYTLIPSLAEAWLIRLHF
jgi:hypothetical protein